MLKNRLQIGEPSYVVLGNFPKVLTELTDYIFKRDPLSEVYLILHYILL